MERKKLSIVILYMCGRKQPLTFINGKGGCMLYMTGKKIRKHAGCWSCTGQQSGTYKYQTAR